MGRQLSSSNGPKAWLPAVRGNAADPRNLAPDLGASRHEKMEFLSRSFRQIRCSFTKPDDGV